MSSYLDSYDSGSYSGSGKADAGGAPSLKMGYGGDPTRYGPGANDWTWAYGSPSDFKRQPTSVSRYSGGGGPSGGNRTSTSTTTFTMPRPTLPKLPTLEMPRVDKRAVAALAQKAAAPGIRTLRESVQTAMNVQSDNPNVRRMTLREALQGYGAGLERVMSGANQQARSEHQQDLNLLAAERQANYRTQVESAMDSYNKAWSEYLASATKKTTTEDGGGAGGQPMVWLRNATGSLDMVPAARTGFGRYMR